MKKKNKKLSRALNELDQAFQNLEVTPLSEERLSEATGAGFTSNCKCGPTNYWECGDMTNCLWP